MITISLCMIVKDEEAVLERCLRSAAPVVDEIIVVDTGSSDRTKEIALSCGAKVLDFPWIEDFAAARNFSFQQATMEYQMWLDADDVILPKDQKKFLQLKASLPPETDVVMLPYHSGFDADGNPLCSFYRERLLKRSQNFQWEGAIHEVIAPRGNILYGDAAVSHKKEKRNDPDRNLRIFRKLLAEGATLAPREQFYYARELYYHQEYAQAIAIFDAFLEQGQGWLENQIDACRHLAWCYQELNQPQQALFSLLRSFQYDRPRAEIRCDLGKYFFQQDQMQQAIYWYQQAAAQPRKNNLGGFVQPACYDYIPYIQLCCCYYRTGDLKKAIAYNKKAGAVRPHDPAYLYNKNFFSQLLQEKKNK